VSAMQTNQKLRTAVLNSLALEQLEELLTNNNEILNIVIDDMKDAVCFISSEYCNYEKSKKQEANRLMEALSIHLNNFKKIRIPEIN
jgi:hypothetical protein